MGFNSWFAGPEPLGERVYRTLVSALYAEPLSLWLATLIGAILTGSATITAPSAALLAGFVLVNVLGLVRTVAVYMMGRSAERHSARMMARIYTVGALAYAAALGAFAAATLLLHPDPSMQAAILSYTMAYAVAISARDAGRPAIAMAQTTAAALPIVLALIAVGNLAFYALTLGILLALPAVGVIVNSLFRSLHDSIAAAETSAELADKMQVLARTDVVTGLANRAGLNHAMAERLATVPDGKSLALFWLDLDRFKEVNDVLGHPIGDRVLAEVAKRLPRGCAAGSLHRPLRRGRIHPALRGRQSPRVRTACRERAGRGHPSDADQ